MLPVHTSSQSDLNEPLELEQHIELAQLLKERYGMMSMSLARADTHIH